MRSIARIALVLTVLTQVALAETGSEFLARTRGLSRSAREAAIERAFKAYDVPDFTWEWAPITTGRVTYYVLPDYLAIGTDADFVRMPMGPITAQRIADAWGCSLPTRKMVDQIWRAATVRLSPAPLPPGPLMMSNDYYARHQAKIEAQRAGRPLGLLTAGHKKDVVLTNRLVVQPGRVAIYGWHYLNGRPIQPLSTVHENGYADYSHGIRIVWGYCDVGGSWVPLADVLRDATLSRELSDEGPLRLTRIPGA